MELTSLLSSERVTLEFIGTAGWPHSMTEIKREEGQINKHSRSLNYSHWQKLHIKIYSCDILADITSAAPPNLHLQNHFMLYYVVLLLEGIFLLSRNY